MSNLKHRRYVMGDFGRLPSLREIHADGDIVEDSLNRVAENVNAHIRTVYCSNDEQVLAIVGVVQLRKGVAEAFTITSNELMAYPVSYTKMIRDLLNLVDAAIGLHRIQMVVLDGFDSGMRWAKALGFACEGLLHKYGPQGQNYWMFARVKHG